MLIRLDEIKDHIYKNFLNFCCYIDPNYLIPNHIALFGQLLNKFAHNEDGYRRLIISLPPRMGKSYTTHIMLPSYLFGLNPKEKILTATYSNDLTSSFSKEIMRIVTSDNYKKIFPETEFINSGRTASTWDTTAGGYLKCSSRDGTLNGLSGTTIIVDDIIKNSKESKSPTLLKNIKEWFDSTLYARMTYQKDGTPPKIVILMTRWSKNDLIGHILDHDTENEWRYINLPAISEDGTALWEERQPLKTLLDIKKRDPEMFACVYQGNPGEKGSTEFNSSKYEIKSILYEYGHNNRPKFYFSSWDTASKISESHDFTVGSLWCVRYGNILTLESIVRGKFTFPELEKLIEQKHSEWDCKFSLIEDASSGTGLLQLLNSKSLSKSKYRRVTANVKVKLPAVIPLLENHEIHLRNFDDLISELDSYPLGKHDDIVASTVNAIYYWLISIRNKTDSVGNTNEPIINSIKKRKKICSQLY